MAYFPETRRQHMLNQAMEELHRLQGDCSTVLGTEGHLLVRDLHQPRVGDAHPVCVATEILEHVAGFAERPFDVGDPSLLLYLRDQPGIGGFGPLGEFARIPGGPQSREDLAAEYLSQHLQRKQVAVLESDEAAAIQAQAASADQHVDVGMVAQFPGPGVQDLGQAEDQPPAGPAQFQQGVGYGAEHGLVDHGRVQPGQSPQFRRQGEYHVEMADGQDPLAACFDPLLLGQGLALGAMPVSA